MVKMPTEGPTFHMALPAFVSWLHPQFQLPKPHPRQWVMAQVTGTQPSTGVMKWHTFMPLHIWQNPQRKNNTKDNPYGK